MEPLHITHDVGLVFVYGTLKKPHGNWQRLLDRDPVANAVAPGFALYDVAYFPGAMRAEDGRARGQVFRVNDEDMMRLDGLEGYRPDCPEWSMYLREITTVVLDDGREVDAWIYVWNSRPGWMNRGEPARCLNDEWAPKEYA